VRKQGSARLMMRSEPVELASEPVELAAELPPPETASAPHSGTACNLEKVAVSLVTPPDLCRNMKETPTTVMSQGCDYSQLHACNLVNSELICLVVSAFYALLLIISAVDASLHIAMGKYAMFAVTCSHNSFLDMYLNIIEAENEPWSHMCLFTYLVCQWIEHFLIF